MDRGGLVGYSPCGHKESAITKWLTFNFLFSGWKKKKESESHIQLCETPWTVTCLAISPWDSPGKNTWVGCHFLSQGFFLIQGSNLCLLHCRKILYCINYQELLGWQPLKNLYCSPNSLSRSVHYPSNNQNISVLQQFPNWSLCFLYCTILLSTTPTPNTT